LTTPFFANPKDAGVAASEPSSSFSGDLMLPGEKQVRTQLQPSKKAQEEK
jgi:hypothetical protein